MDQYIGHYRIISELGRGGMGVVYKAHEESLNRFVALKVLGAHLAEDPSYVERFVREAQSAARLSHPNIVQIYAISEHEGQHYFAMEYVSGKTVQQLLKTEGSMETARAERIVLQAASALQEAHAQGIIHRDIKPANLIIDDRGLVKITDFGLAIVLGGAARLTATGIMMGTPGYLSPEQCRNEDVDHRTDIYSLGVTFYEMLTGTIPFSASTPLALIRQIVDTDPPDVRELNPEVDDRTSDILGRMMAKDRDQRFANCTELIETVQRDLAARTADRSVTSAGAESIPPPPPPSDAEGVARLNVDPTVAVDTGEERPVVSTEPVDAGTAPAAQPLSITPPPTPGRRRLAVLAALAVILVALGALAVGAVAVWRFGLADRIAALASRAAEPRPTAVAADDESAAAEHEVVEMVPSMAAGSVGEQPEPATESVPPPEPEPEPATRGGEVTPSVPSRGQAAVVPRSVAPEPAPGTAEEPATTGEPEHPSTPPPTGVAVVAVGETLLAGQAESYLESALRRFGARVVDEGAQPEVARLLASDQAPPRGAVREALRPYARHLIMVRAEYLGERPLTYMGRADVAFQARLTAIAVDLESGRVVGTPLREQVEYTHLTVERVVREKLRGWLVGVARDVAGRW